MGSGCLHQRKETHKCHACKYHSQLCVAVLACKVDVLLAEAGPASQLLPASSPAINFQTFRGHSHPLHLSGAEAAGLAEECCSRSHITALHWQGLSHNVLSTACRYHSHPHITVLPSHVDVRTQAMYQKLDEGFVGIIVSAFNQVGH